MKKLEQILKKDGLIDTRKKINRSTRHVDNRTLNKIEQGITSEQLNNLAKVLPIYKYQTQITIHGHFPQLTENYLHGYKSIFQNKNGSIGVKWIAIDEGKRQEIWDTLRLIDFYYRRNSQDHSFLMMELVTPETLKEAEAKYRQLADKIDTRLFYGSKQIYFGRIPYRGTYIVLELTINAIEQKNVQTLLDDMGYDQNWKKQQEREMEEDQVERERKAEIKRKERAQAKQQALEQAQDQITWLKSNFPYKELTKQEGCYIQVKYSSFQNKVRFARVEVRKKGAHICHRTNYFNTAKEAVNAKNDVQPFKKLYIDLQNVYVLTIPSQKQTGPKKEDKRSSKVEIVKYSSKAIAVFGDTRPIKDNLKQIGCRFNPFLKRNGKKEAGWIAPVNMREQIEAVL